MATMITRWEPFRNLSTLQEQVNRLFETSLKGNGDNSSLTAWAPAVDIYEDRERTGLEGGPSGDQREGFGHPGREQHAHGSRRAESSNRK